VGKSFSGFAPINTHNNDGWIGSKDETIRARAIEQDAAGFLLKPFSDAGPLVAAITTALQGI
jgi:hypothetical protein